MDIQKLVSDLKEERLRIDKAIAALEALSGRETKGVQPKRRKLSAAARKAISQAAKRRWAAQKAKEGKSK